MPELDPEDAKLLTLARSARARTRAAEGASVRDLDGRTYAGATVSLPSLHLSAVGVAVAMAVSSAAAGLEAVVVVTDADALDDDDVAAVRELAGAGVPVHLADTRGRVHGRVTT
jgi:alpha/beta hydrolase fold